MEPWKIGVILALIVGLGGYKYYETNAPPPAPAPTPNPEEIVIGQRFDKMVGQPAPAWDIEPKLWGNTPKPITLNDLKGSVTLIEFWRTGCSHCRAAAPFMQKRVFEKYKPNGLKVVTFHSPAKHADPNDPELKWDEVQGAMRELGIKYPVAFDTDAKLFRDKYNGTSFPSVFILDRQGIVRYAHAGSPTHTPQIEAEFFTALHKQLGLKPPSTPGTPNGMLGTTKTDPTTIIDPHRGHNHPPGVEHPPAPADSHEGHNHPPGMGHGQAPTGHEGHNHPPGVSH